MTAGIRVLPERLIGRIAAGEVVERPGSAVKELVENALDAGAGKVQVDVEGSVTELIRVADDGEGIAPRELHLAVERHATSKLRGPDDLDHITSLGFRGEGLAAIGAVSRLRLASRPQGTESGGELFVEDGKIGETVPVGRSPGTTVEVRDLFFNTPARRRYLKSPAAELRYISQLLQAYALAHPEVHFVLTVNEKTNLDLPAAADLHGRMGQIMGPKRVDTWIPILREESDFGLEGFVGAPENARTRAGHQVFLINGRWVTSPLLRTAVREAYSDLIPPGRHPEAVLHLRVPADELDVNVHPTKREVRLLHERRLYPRLISGLRSVVEERFPVLHLREQPQAEPGDTPESQIPLGLYLSRGPSAATIGAAEGGTGYSAPPEVIPFPTEARVDAGEENDGDSAAPAMASMWQLHETYILAAVSAGLLIIDQHAAHERILYEQALRRMRGDSVSSQQLLFPIMVELTNDEFTILLEAHALLEKLGFHLENFGGTSVLVHAIPAGLREWRHGALLRDVLDHFTDLPESLDVEERVARSVACHGAVKARQKLSLVEMNSLVDQLFATEKPQGDPHGRPVFLKIELGELHRRFGRSG